MKKTIFFLLFLCVVAAYLLWLQIKQDIAGTEKTTQIEAIQQQQGQTEGTSAPLEDKISVGDDVIDAGLFKLENNKNPKKDISEVDRARAEEFKKAVVENLDTIRNFSAIMTGNFKEACQEIAKDPDSIRKCYHNFKAYMYKECEAVHAFNERIKCFTKPDIQKYRTNYTNGITYYEGKKPETSNNKGKEANGSSR